MCNFAPAVPVLLAAGGALDGALPPRLSVRQLLELQDWQLQFLHATRAKTPLERAVALGHLEVAQQLLAAGARLTSAHIGVLHFLTEAGGDVAKSRAGTPPGRRPAGGSSRSRADPGDNHAAAAAVAGPGEWDWPSVCSALRGLLAPAGSSGWRLEDPRLPHLRRLVDLHQQLRLVHTDDLRSRLLREEMRGPPHIIVNDLPLAQLWAATPALRRQPLLMAAAMACLHGSQPVLTWLLSRPPAQAVPASGAHWPDFWAQEYEAWQQQVPRPPFQLLLNSSGPPDAAAPLVAASSAAAAATRRPRGAGQAVMAMGGASIRNWGALRAVLAAGGTISVHTVNQVTTLYGMQYWGPSVMRYLLSWAGCVPPVPQEYALVSWCPIYCLLEHHLRQQKGVALKGPSLQQTCHERCLALLETLLAAGYRPTPTFNSAIQADGTLVRDYCPLASPPPGWEVEGRNRWLWLAARQPAWSPQTSTQFPPASRAAVCTLLLISTPTLPSRKRRYYLEVGRLTQEHMSGSKRQRTEAERPGLGRGWAACPRICCGILCARRCTRCPAGLTWCTCRPRCAGVAWRADAAGRCGRSAAAVWSRFGWVGLPGAAEHSTAKHSMALVEPAAACD